MKRLNYPPSFVDGICATTDATSKTSGGTVCTCFKALVDPRHAIEGFKYIKPDIACFFLI
jgi:hypothetical protein